MSIVASDVRRAKIVFDDTEKTIRITLINDDTKEEECVYIIGTNVMFYNLFMNFSNMYGLEKTDSMTYIYNGEDITNEVTKFPVNIGIKDGDKIYVRGVPPIISINFVDENGEIITLTSHSDVKVWRVLKEYSARKSMNSVLSQLLYFRWYFNGAILSIDHLGTLTQLGITSGALIYFKVVYPTEEKINNLMEGIGEYVGAMGSDYFIGQTIVSRDDGSFGRIRSCRDFIWTVEFENGQEHQYTMEDLVSGLQRVYTNIGILYDFQSYLSGLVDKFASDAVCLANQIMRRDKMVILKSLKMDITKLFKIEQEIDELIMFIRKIKEFPHLNKKRVGLDGIVGKKGDGLDGIVGILSKLQTNTNEIKKSLYQNHMYKANKPILKVGESIYAHCQSKWEPGVVESFSQEGVGEYGPCLVYNIKLDRGDTIDVNDGGVMCQDEFLKRRVEDWKGVKHVCDKDSSDSWARNIGWYTVDVFGVEESFTNIANALRVYDAQAVYSKGLELRRSDLNFPKDWDTFFTLASPAILGTGSVSAYRVIKFQRLAIRLMIMEERLARPSLNDLFTSFHNGFFSNGMDPMNHDDCKFELGRRWKVALSHLIGKTKEDKSCHHFFDFALLLQSVKAHFGIPNICRFFIGVGGDIDEFLIRVPIFREVRDALETSHFLVEYLQTNKPENADDFICIWTKHMDVTETRRHAVECNDPLKELLVDYATEMNVSIKSLRIKHNGTTLFLSSIGKKVPLDLGIEEDDVLEITIMQSTQTETTTNEQSKQQSSPKGKNKKKKKHKKSKKKRAQPLVIQKTEVELKVEHSKLLGKVYEEAESQFKEIRQRLNALNLERTKPKQRTLPTKAKPVEVVDNPLGDNGQLGGKAGKTQFIIQVGEVSNL